MDAHKCAKLIQGYNASEDGLSIATIQIIYPEDIVTTDFRIDRVRIYVNPEGSVIKIPDRG